MPQLCSILLFDVTLPTFSNELFVLEPLFLTEVVFLLSILCHTLKVSLRCASFASSLIVKLAIIANTNRQSTCKLY